MHKLVFILVLLICAVPTFAQNPKGSGGTFPGSDDVGYDEVLDEASGLTKRPQVNFIGGGVTCVDNSGSTRTDCTIPANDGVGYDEVLDEAGGLTKRPQVNFVGAGVTCVDNGGDTRTDCTIPGTVDGVGYDEVLDEGGGLTKRPQVNFIGAGVTCVDNGGSTRTDCTIPGGGGGGGETAIKMLPDDAKFGGTTDAALLQCPEWCEVLYSTGDEAIWAFRVPGHYSGTLTVEIQYKMVAGTTDNVAWGSEFKCVTPGDSTDFDAASFDTQDDSADDAVPGTTGYVAEHTWTVVNDDSIAAGDFCSFRLERIAPSGSDASGDAELLGVALTW